ncbi:hypothetical protein PVAP13_9KG238900 [Panicum virgatum]|uniref:DUF4220 domain-containing protein n=1 Tax=Panicum virgatum TaxID=38727 RepID=A0A8T0NLL2_PANVG|nr:hypothetical protein PVAP13_9KG238900 [Panicum virgatum]
MLRVNGLTLSNAVLAGILVGIGNYGTRYRHRAFVRALFQGANTLFLPILSYVASNASTGSNVGKSPIISTCVALNHLFLVLIWAGLVHIVGINTSTIVAASKREGRISGLPMVLVVQAIWSTYLVASLITPDSYFDPDQPTMTLLPITFALIFAKITFSEFRKAQHSFAFGCNPPLIVGHMKQLLGSKYQHGGMPDEPRAEHCCPPALIVMGEDRDKVEKGAHGFFFKRMLCSSGLVTIDKVWLLDDTILTSPTTWRLKEVCLSFTLFKLLRCRFAGYTVAEAGFQQIRGFFLHVLLSDKDHERVHRVIRDELSFLHDYYYSSTPTHYSTLWLPIVNICISLLTLTCCLLLPGMGVGYFILEKHSTRIDLTHQVICRLFCYDENSHELTLIRSAYIGNLVYDVVPVAILLVLVVLAEAREIASYICSNWTKVALFCRFVVNNHDEWQRSPRMQRWIGRVLRCKSKKLMTQWDDKMCQCSVLVMHPRRIDPVVSLVMRLLRLPDRKKNVKVPGVLKARIFNALASNNGLLTDPKTFLCRILEEDDGIGSSSNDFLWACESEGISDLLLTWHIATSILEMGQQGQQQLPRLSDDDKIVATHLSQYCAYLVAYVPELLLPDDDEWCKGLYKAVKKDCTSVLGARVASTPTAEATSTATGYTKLLSLLQEPEPKLHAVLMNGVKLGKQLVQLQQGEAAAWRFLAGFWSGMILYIAPSDNLRGHAEAIARSGELITMVWALLMNVGIASRPSTAEGSSATGDCV